MPNLQNRYHAEYFEPRALRTGAEELPPAERAGGRALLLVRLVRALDCDRDLDLEGVGRFVRVRLRELLRVLLRPRLGISSFSGKEGAIAFFA